MQNQQELSFDRKNPSRQNANSSEKGAPSSGTENVETKATSQSVPPGPLTVSQITAKVKGLLEKDIGSVWVKGEISNYKPSTAGHIYFSLKDEGATLSCAMFRGRNQSSSKFQLKDGMEVLVRGKISVYAPRGNYQLIAEQMEPLGHGALQLAFEQLRSKLQEEGLFNAERKRQIPAYPQRIVLITSPTGAVLQDMLNVLGRRNAGISLLIIPTMVQGDEAPPKICQALAVANRFNLGDVIVVARGGGSMEDLWCFNNEDVVRAVAGSRIPVISAVGHEVDFTLCDFAADLRAPTPSAAAELVSKNRLELLELLASTQKRLGLSISHRIARFRQQILTLESRMVSPSQRLNLNRAQIEELNLRLNHAMEGRLPFYKQRLDEFSLKLTHNIDKKIDDRRHRLDFLTGTLEALSPLKVLGRGYTLVRDSESQDLLKSSQQAKTGKIIDLVFFDGSKRAEILNELK